MIWPITMLVTSFIFAILQVLFDASDDFEAKKRKDVIEQAACDKFNAENEGVNLLYRTTASADAQSKTDSQSKKLG